MRPVVQGETLSSYMSSFVRAPTNVVVVPFVQFGLEVTKNLLATALVESAFSTVSMVKSKGRCALDTCMLNAACIMKQAPSFFDPSLSFRSLWEDMQPLLVEWGELKKVRTKYQKRRHVVDPTPPGNTFHVSSNNF